MVDVKLRGIAEGRLGTSNRYCGSDGSKLSSQNTPRKGRMSTRIFDVLFQFSKRLLSPSYSERSTLSFLWSR